MVGASHTEHWGPASEVTFHSSLVELGHVCPKCGGAFEPGQYVRTRYGPRGGTTFHDDCTTAHDGDEEEVEDERPRRR